jgi:hypothetical protein
MNSGTSYGKRMTFEEHVESYPNKEELQQYKRLNEISTMMHSGQTDQAMGYMVKEFQSIENAITLFEELKKKVFSGWKSL